MDLSHTHKPATLKTIARDSVFDRPPMLLLKQALRQ
jgi:hypothetical protein